MMETVANLSTREVPADSTKLPAGIRSNVAGTVRRSLPLKSLNHVSVHCADVEESLRFYRDLMGFIPIRRPACLNFDGAWLYNYGIGIHLLKDPHKDVAGRYSRAIDPRSDHVSFQCEDIDIVEDLLRDQGVPFVRQAVEENGIMVQQLFFHDPDGHMIEICNCDALPVVPLAGAETSKCTWPGCCIAKAQASETDGKVQLCLPANAGVAECRTLETPAGALAHGDASSGAGKAAQPAVRQEGQEEEICGDGSHGVQAKACIPHRPAASISATCKHGKPSPEVTSEFSVPAGSGPQAAPGTAVCMDASGVPAAQPDASSDKSSSFFLQQRQVQVPAGA